MGERPESTRRWALRPKVPRVSTTKLLFTLILLFALTPLMERLPDGNLVESGLITLVMVACLVALGQERRFLLVAFLLLLPTIAGKWLNHFFPSHIPPTFFYFFAILFFGFTIYRILCFILHTAYVDREVLSAGVVVYLMLGLLWSLAYLLHAELTPGSFRFPTAIDSAHALERFDAFYFSFSTLTTAGFGDITPVSKVARTLAVMETVTGTLYLAILISRLVGLYSPPPQANASAPSDEQ